MTPASLDNRQDPVDEGEKGLGEHFLEPVKGECR
jgi:hypothetical protein